MTFTIRPAVREKIGLLFSIAGASGSGKTMTALQVAKGIANGTGKIALIDTEAGRGLHYAPPPGKKAGEVPGTFDFLHLDFQPPFTPQRYIDAIRACEEAGATVIVIDSMTHEWLGEGGCSDMQSAEAERLATYDGVLNPNRLEAVTAPAWKRPKALHQRMMSRLIQTRTHLIFCLRAQEKIKIVKKAPPAKGTEIVPIGFQPLCEKNFPFEMSGSIMLNPEHPGCPDYEMVHKLNDVLQGIFPDRQLIGPEAGQRLRAWAEIGEDRAPPDKATIAAREIIEHVDDATTLAAIALVDNDPKVKKVRARLAETRPELAKQVDDAIANARSLLESVMQAPVDSELPIDNQPPESKEDRDQAWANDQLAWLAEPHTSFEVDAWSRRGDVKTLMARLKDQRPELFATVKGAAEAKQKQSAPADTENT